MNRKMGLLLRCAGLLAVLWFGPASASYFGQRFRREDGVCVSCVGAACKEAKTSDCKTLVTAAEGSTEKEVVDKLADTLGKENVAAEKLLSCYTLTFKIGDKPGEIRDCGPDGVCATLKEKAADLKITIEGCTDCKKAATACNNGTAAGQDKTPPPGPVVSESAGPGEISEATSEGTTTAAGGGKEKSGAPAVHMLSNPVYLMWVTLAVLLLRLE